MDRFVTGIEWVAKIRPRNDSRTAGLQMPVPSARIQQQRIRLLLARSQAAAQTHNLCKRGHLPETITGASPCR